MFFKLFVLFGAVCLPAIRAQLGEAPCNVNDLSCIREFFASWSSCNPDVFGNVPATLTTNNVKFQVPAFNTSHDDQQIILKGLNKCTVAILYRNDTLHRTVLGLNCKNLHVEAEREFIVHSPGRIDQVYLIKVVADYAEVKLSMNLHGDILDICRETAYGFSTIPTLFLQGRNAKSVQFVRNDPLGMFGRHLSTWIREIWADRATPLFRTWVRNALCDFNCKLHPNSIYQFHDNQDERK